ncbi:MAG: FixH family protein [Acidobacteriota bacterium]|nr:FixH family protein [Acidobacteriota bacterium]
MKAKFPALLLFAITLALIAAACSKSGSADGGKIIKSAKSSDMTVTLSNSTGELKNGDNELMVTFTDAAGKPVDVGAASLNIHMAAMGTMAEMNNKATLTTTETPGKYHARVNIEMKGTWEAQVKYQGAHGTGQTSMTVQAK